MTAARVGLLWALAFVVLEAIQFVFFGNIFQRVSSVTFGAIVFAIGSISFIVFSALRHPDQLRIAFQNPKLLWQINLSATLAWLCFLLSVQMIEPAVAYTIGAGVMPLTTWAAHRFGLPEGDPMRNRTELWGVLIITAAMILLTLFTLTGATGFTRGGAGGAVAGILLAIGDGVFFTILLIYCQRLDRRGVGPATVFGLRFPLYIATATALSAAGFDHKETLATSEFALIIALGLALIIPPLYALQKAVALVSTLTISAITALGPFIIFVLQMLEGRVDYAPATLTGLFLYFAGAILAAIGAVKASRG